MHRYFHYSLMIVVTNVKCPAMVTSNGDLVLLPAFWLEYRPLHAWYHIYAMALFCQCRQLRRTGKSITSFLQCTCTSSLKHLWLRLGILFNGLHQIQRWGCCLALVDGWKHMNSYSNDYQVWLTKVQYYTSDCFQFIKIDAWKFMQTYI